VVGGQRRGKQNTGGGFVSILDGVESIRQELGADLEVQRVITADTKK
jgi:hypothetical protein